MSITKLLSRSITDSTKTAMKRVCMLKPMEPEHQVVHLEHGKNIVGRSKVTGIRDARCSKEQLELQVDMDGCKIQLKVLGVNPCAVNGLMAMQDTVCSVEHGDLLEIVYGRHTYEVIFKPPPEGNRETDRKKETTEEQLKDSWDSVDNGKMMVFTSAGVRSAEKIAGYDIDGTIIRTKSGNVFPKNINDWQINYPEVPGKLKRLHEDGYKICFFTNQGGIARGKVNLDEFKEKIRLIHQKLGVPVQVFIAISDGYYRKPLPGMWEHLKEHKNDGVSIRIEKSFFVGDAAGRPEFGTGVSKRKKDHSLVDRLFAINIGLSFYTPEEHFLGRKTEHWIKPEFDPKIVDNSLTLFDPESTRVPADSCEVILLMGLPGSGKSHFAMKHLKPLGYTVLNADTLGSTQACLKGCERELREGNSCVIDNTNVDVDSRKKFVDLAKSHQVPCRCFVMNIPLAHVKHNVAYRQLVDTKHSKVNDMVMNMMKKKYKEPTAAEGFSEVVRVNLKLKFEDVKQEELYKLYLVEK